MSKKLQTTRKAPYSSNAMLKRGINNKLKNKSYLFLYLTKFIYLIITITTLNINLT